MAPDKLILYISRHADQRKIFTGALEAAGYSVVSADCGHSAKTEIERLREGAIDLIIMGSLYRNPNFSWTQDFPETEKLEKAILGMKEKAPPILVHTSYSEDAAKALYRDKPLNRYVSDYLSKNSDDQVIVQKVNSMIGPA
ncbi:MAG: hypothetical protein KKC75_04185 [Nanoarchaeota archaeon]|nr:hypothetical protein [Nanoarchaeota archaeon]MBU1946089.1 hypothetical protein [Nanoarchaeota archaeon]